MQRLYYHESEDAFYFAAEAKAILAVRPELRALDFRGVGEFISCGAVLENRSLFPGIGVLPPGVGLDFQKRIPQKKVLLFPSTGVGGAGKRSIAIPFIGSSGKCTCGIFLAISADRNLSPCP